MHKGFKLLLTAAAITLLTTACTITFSPDELESAPAQPAPSRSVNPRPVSPPSSPQAVPTFPRNEVLTYNCDGGRLLVKYTSNDSAEVFADGWQNLSRTTSRDGWFVYKDSNHEWYAQGRQGLLRRDGKDLMTGCRL